MYHLMTNCQAAAELGPLVVSLQELAQLERELEQAEWRQAVKVRDSHM